MYSIMRLNTFLGLFVLLTFPSFSQEKATSIGEKESVRKVDFRYQPREWQTCFGLKDDSYKSVIAKDGGLWYDFTSDSLGTDHIGFPYPNYCYERNKGYTVAIFPQLITNDPASEEKQEMLGPDKPIIFNKKNYDNIEYNQTVFASFADKSNKLSSRYDVCDINVKNEGKISGNARFRIEFNTIYEMSVDESGKKVFIKKNGEKQLLCEFPIEAERFAGHISKMKYTYYLDFPPKVLQPGASTEFSFIVHRSQPAKSIDLSFQMEDELAKMKKYWEELALPYNSITVPDKGIQRLLTSIIRNIYQAREIKQGIPAFQVGPTFYRGTWAVDGPFFMEAMAYLGKEDEVREAIEGIFKVGESQGPSGELFSKQSGLRIWMVWRHAQLTGDYDWLEKVWGSIVDEVETIKQYRANSYKDGNPLTNGLMPMGIPDGGIEGVYAEYTNNYWVLSGLNQAIQAAKKLEKEEAVKEWEAMFDDYSKKFNAARERDKKTDEFGNTYVPTFMGENTLNPTSGQWAFMHSIFPGKIYDNNDPLMTGTLDMLDSNLEEGLIWGTGWLPKGLWTYSASFHGHAHLWLGNGKRVPQILYDFANHASPLLCWSEEQHPVDYKGKYLLHGDMPHNWASVEFIRLIRHSLVLERDNELHFFEGLPKEWLKPGMVTKLDDISTTHGIVSLELKVSENGEYADLIIEMNNSMHEPPKAIVVHNEMFNSDHAPLIFNYKPGIKTRIKIQ